jgi:hypothetical protein
MWQEIDEGILPALYGAVSPTRRAARSTVRVAYWRWRRRREARENSGALSERGCRRLWEISEQLTGVSYPTAN